MNDTKKVPLSRAFAWELKLIAQDWVRHYEEVEGEDGDLAYDVALRIASFADPTVHADARGRIPLIKVTDHERRAALAFMKFWRERHIDDIRRGVYPTISNRFQVFKKSTKWMKAWEEGTASIPKAKETSHPLHVREEAEAIAEETLKRGVRALRLKRYDFSFVSHWEPCIRRHRWHRRQTGSRGGWYGDGFAISLSYTGYVPVSGEGVVRWKEYQHIENNPVYGGFVGDWRLVVKALTLHELAHAAQDGIKKVGRHRKIDYRTAHGQGFQQILRVLRMEVLNPELKTAGIMK